MYHRSTAPTRIFLVGFMCVGKSRIGKELAPLVGLPFVDIDRVVEKRIGPITPFIQNHGEEAFRIEESKVLAELISGDSALIATGGGTPCSDDNMERMNANGITVWLDMPMEHLMPIIERAGGDRPLLYGLKGAALQERVQELLKLREPVYATADLIVQAGDAPAVVIDRVRSALGLLQTK